MTSYQDKRKAFLNDQKASKVKPVRVLAMPKGESKPEPVQDLVRVPIPPEAMAGRWEIMERTEAIAKGKEFEEIPDAEKKPQWWLTKREKPTELGRRSGHVQVYGSGDTTTVVTNDDGSPYVFQSGSRKEQEAELKAAIRAKVKDLSPDVGINIH